MLLVGLNAYPAMREGTRVRITCTAQIHAIFIPRSNCSNVIWFCRQTVFPNDLPMSDAGGAAPINEWCDVFAGNSREYEVPDAFPNWSLGLTHDLVGQ